MTIKGSLTEALDKVKARRDLPGNGTSLQKKPSGHSTGKWQSVDTLNAYRAARNKKRKDKKQARRKACR